MTNDSSTGPDGRAPAELKALPLWIWELIAQVFDTILAWCALAQWPSKGSRGLYSQSQ